MAEAMRLIRTRLIEGVWEGVLDRPADATGVPQIKVTHLGAEVEGVAVERDPDSGKWQLRVPIPVTTISDGVQTYLITDALSGAVLDSFAIHAGDPLAEDIRAEIGLLREELDMLKKAFRRHCIETAGQ
ncbi:MAG: hypothetical protein HLUCCA08_16740 [Rhodobacteraceae bacterium HLUCCA08]|nr:MAG: hypothetical protein HLUCCA08_16740 [Rhodobacteraceae bacterium HLUCCA08]